MQEIVNDAEKADAQVALHAALIAQLASQGKCAIGFRGGGGMHPVWSNGEGNLYYAYAEPYKDQAVERHWNSFGWFARGGQLRIVVEINIPVETDEVRAQGFFARDASTGATLLMHSGRMGGGVKGLTHAAFYAWSGEEPVIVHSGISSRAGVVVAEVGSPEMVAQITQFVRRIAAFKSDLEQGLLEQPEFGQKRRDAERLIKEFVGRKSGQRSNEFTYETYHGAVVDALAAERGQTLGAGQTLDKTVLIDLSVWQAGSIAEVYEVKSKLDRASLYGAIGQLVTHCGAGARDIRRTLVLPEGEIMTDIEAALFRENIDVRRYRLIGSGEATRVKLL